MTLPSRNVAGMLTVTEFAPALVILYAIVIEPPSALILGAVVVNCSDPNVPVLCTVFGGEIAVPDDPPHPESRAAPVMLIAATNTIPNDLCIVTVKYLLLSIK